MEQLRPQSELAQENDYFMPNIFPALRCRPDRVKGIPVLREIFCLSLVKPMARFHENVNPGPSFISILPFHLRFKVTLHRIFFLCSPWFSLVPHVVDRSLLP